MRVIHGEKVFGGLVDDETRCAHYHSDPDIIAIKFKCCGKWFPCRQCHDEGENHDAEVWQQREFSYCVVLCGACGEQLSVDRYLRCENKCPACLSSFNPGCSKHYDLYFEM